MSRAFAAIALAALGVFAVACSLLSPRTDHAGAATVAGAVLPVARTALDAGQVETARRLYQRLLDVDPESFQARMGLGEVAQQKRDAAQAARWFLAALAYARTVPQRHDALLHHGRAALDAGHLESAAGSFARLTDPQEAAATEYVAYGLNGVGLTRYFNGDLRGAVTLMERAVETLPGDQKLRGNLALALESLAEQVANTSSAEDELTAREAAREPPTPQPPAAPRDQGQMQAAADRIEQAVSRFEQAAERLADAATRETGTAAQQRETPPPTATRPPVSPPQAVPEEGRPPHPAEDAAPAPETETVPPPPQRAETAIADVPAPLEALPEPRRQADRAGAAPPVTPAPAESPPEPQGQADRADAVPPETPLPARDAPAPAEEVPSPTPPASPGAKPLAGFLVIGDDGPFVQMGAYASRATANALANRLRAVTEQPVRVGEGDGLHRVRIGPLKTEAGLRALVGALRDAGYGTVRMGAAEPPPPAPVWPAFVVEKDDGAFLQVGAFAARATADARADVLRGVTALPVRVSAGVAANDAAVHRVHVGPLASDAALYGLVDALAATGHRVRLPAGTRIAPAKAPQPTDAPARSVETPSPSAEPPLPSPDAPLPSPEVPPQAGESERTATPPPRAPAPAAQEQALSAQEQVEVARAPPPRREDTPAQPARQTPPPAPDAPDDSGDAAVSDGAPDAATPAAEEAGATPVPAAAVATAPEDDPPPPAPVAPRGRAYVITQDEGVFIQIGDYDARTEAEALATRLRGLTVKPVQVVRQTEGTRAAGTRAPFYRVRVGPVETDADYEALQAAVAALGFDVQ